jgi:hypothetical protein
LVDEEKIEIKQGEKKTEEKWINHKGNFSFWYISHSKI